MPLVQSFRAQVQAIPIEVLEPEQLGSPPPSIESLLVKYVDEMHILPNNAHLLAVVQRLGVPYVATLDRDFERASSRGFTIYTYIPT
jgi:predicted nucleic acid-binding protein